MSPLEEFASRSTDTRKAEGWGIANYQSPAASAPVILELCSVMVVV
jgi:hypothetical protein